MKRLLLTIVLMSAVLVASGACRGTAKAAARPDTKKDCEHREDEEDGKVQILHGVQVREPQKAQVREKVGLRIVSGTHHSAYNFY